MTLDLEKFDPNKAQLQKLVDESKALTVTDFEDAEQIKVVKKSRLALRDARVAITKMGKGMREEALKFQKDVIAREKELVGIIEPEEERLQAFEDKADAIKEVKRREALLPARKAKLDEIKDGIVALDDELLLMDDEAFNTYYNGRIFEKNRKDRADIETREQAVKDEELRQQREKDRQASEERGRQQERERLEREEREKGEREARAQADKLKARADRLIAIGLVFDGKEYKLDDFIVDATEVAADSEEVFEKKVRGIMDEKKRRKEAEDKAIREAAEKEKMEKAERYKMWLATNGYNEETAKNFFIKPSDTVYGRMELYRKVSEYDSK